jgi:sRNA-binding carbon storage regulator CsrA
MLVLTITKGDPLVLTMPDGRRIRVMIQTVKDKERVALTIDAPDDVEIDRASIRLQKDKAKSANLPTEIH